MPDYLYLVPVVLPNVIAVVVSLAAIGRLVYLDAYGKIDLGRGLRDLRSSLTR